MNIFEDANWWISVHERRGPLRGHGFNYGVETPYGTLISDSRIYETGRLVNNAEGGMMTESFVEILFRVTGKFRFVIHLKLEPQWPAIKNCVKVYVRGRSRAAVYPVITRSEFKLIGRTKMEEVDFFLTMLKLTHEPA